MNNPNATTSKEFTCDLCGEEFDSVTDLEEHKLKHIEPIHETMSSQGEIRGDIGAAGLPTSPVR
jgi:hypothetical protein